MLTDEECHHRTPKPELDHRNVLHDDYKISPERRQIIEWFEDSGDFMDNFLAADYPDEFLKTFCDTKIIKAGICLGLQRTKDHPNWQACRNAWVNHKIEEN